jgi:hypothetical protein
VVRVGNLPDEHPHDALIRDLRPQRSAENIEHQRARAYALTIEALNVVAPDRVKWLYDNWAAALDAGIHTLTTFEDYARLVAHVSFEWAEKRNIPHYWLYLSAYETLLEVGLTGMPPSRLRLARKYAESKPDADLTEERDTSATQAAKFAESMMADQVDYWKPFLEEQGITFPHDPQISSLIRDNLVSVHARLDSDVSEWRHLARTPRPDKLSLNLHAEWNPHIEPRNVAEKRILEALKEQVNQELTRIYSQVIDAPGAVEPEAFKDDRSFRRFIKYQVLGHDQPDIAAEEGVSEQAVSKSVNDVAKLLELELRKPGSGHHSNHKGIAHRKH